MVGQQQLDTMAEELRSQGLTWSQTAFAVSLVRNAQSAERERCAKLCEEEAKRWDEETGYTRNQFEAVPQDGCDACAARIRQA
jgi:MinD superfamily P-loop ATPase